MRIKHRFVLNHIRIKDEVGTIKSSLSPPVAIFVLTTPRQCSFVDPFCYLFFVSVMLSCLLCATLWTPDRKGLASWFSCV